MHGLSVVVVLLVERHQALSLPTLVAMARDTGFHLLCPLYFFFAFPIVLWLFAWLRFSELLERRGAARSIFVHSPVLFSRLVFCFYWLVGVYKSSLRHLVFASSRRIAFGYCRFEYSVVCRLIEMRVAIDSYF